MLYYLSDDVYQDIRSKSNIITHPERDSSSLKRANDDLKNIIAMVRFMYLRNTLARPIIPELLKAPRTLYPTPKC